MTMGRKRKRQAGVMMIEYMLVCVLIAVVGASTVPLAVSAIRTCFEVVLTIVSSPHPAFF